MGIRTLNLGGRETVRIGLGTNRLTHTPEHVQFIRDAVEAGVEMIDTAYTYTGGDSEKTIGAALGAAHGSVVVATKGGFRAGTGRPGVLRAQIEESLRRLQTRTIDLYYLHRVDPETPLEDSLGAIREYVDRGAIGHVGLSQVNIEQIERARRVVPIVAVQNHYNLAERGWDDVIDHCAREGIVFVPYFPLRADGGPSVARVAQAHGATAAQITLAWLLRRSPAILPIPGSLSLAHVSQNLAAAAIELTDDEFEAVSQGAAPGPG
jgi:pyridoxine 4-dehydrogenase